MPDDPVVHLHWKDLLNDSFPPGVEGPMLFPKGRLRVLTRCDCHHGSGAVVDHDHEFFEIALVVSGSGLHKSLYGSKRMKRGDVFILPPRVWHRYTDCRRLKVYNCCIGEELFQQHLSFLRQDPFWSSFLFPVAISRQPQWVSEFRLRGEDLVNVEKSLLHLQDLTQHSFVFETNYQLLGRLMWMFGEIARGLRDASLQEAAPATLHPLIQRALGLINADLDRDWRAADLCAELNRINPAYFVRLFKHDVGMTPKAYITQRRLEKAANRLLTTDDRVTEIALSLGWNDPNLFSRRFRQYFGTTPREYRGARA